MLLIENATIISPPDTWAHHDILIDGETIVQVAPHGQVSASQPFPRFDAAGLIVTPGWIDVQVNGGFGHDFTLDPSAIWAVAARLPELGLTAFLPTIITAPSEVRERAIHVLKAGPPQGWQGARPLGLHFEGPFLNPERRGVHPPQYLRPPDVSLVQGWTRANGVWLVTLAPELDGIDAVVNHLAAAGVVVSMGHTLATWEEAEAGFAWGITYGTHLFNAMRGFHHREPGAVGALLARADIPVGLIVDGVHVHPAAVRIAWACKSPETVTLVTDACAGLGMPPGRYRLGAMEIVVSEDRATLPDGTLAGSIVTPARALRNLMAFTGCTLVEAITTVTIAPARVLGLDTPRVAPGHTADLTLITPEVDVVATVIGGKIRPTQPGRAHRGAHGAHRPARVRGGKSHGCL